MFTVEGDASSEDVVWLNGVIVSLVSGSTILSITCGVILRPPLAIAAVQTPTCKGETKISP